MAAVRTKHAKTQLYFMAIGVVFLAIFSSLIYRAIRYGDITFVNSTSNWYVPYMCCVLWTSITGTTFLVSAVCLHISCMTSSKSHNTVKSVLLGYIMNMVMHYASIFPIRSITASSKQPRRTQETLLQDWMKRDADTEYGKQHHFKSIKTLKDLQAHHPLTDYPYYADCVKRMANGDENILIRGPLGRFGITSGTTGKGKLIPLPKTRLMSQVALSLVYYAAAAEKFGWASPLQKDLFLYVNPKPTKTPSGLLIGPMILFTDQHSGFMPSITNNIWEIFSITTEFEAYYLTLLFGVSDKNIGKFTGPFSSMVHKAMALLEKNWRRIVNDISTGRVDEALDIAPEVRNACDHALSPDPERAQELQEEFEKGFDGIMRRVWPNMTYIVGTDTSDFNDKLKNGYAQGVPIFSPMYGSTEGDYGVNLFPRKPSQYALVPYSAIYEFIPEDDMNENQPTTLLIDEVEKGQKYEMVVSTTSGFYRYRFGDVIEVVDFYNATPVVKFLYRSGQLMNLRAEKVTELSVNEAVYRVASHWSKARVVHWTSAESTMLSKIPDNNAEFETGQQFYLVFVELEGDVDHNILDVNLQKEFDTVLKDANNYYRGYRNAGTISQPKVYLVKPGSFKLLQDHIIDNSTATYNQYKAPRKLRTADTLTLMLNARVLA